MTYIREPTYEISYFFRRILVPFDGSAASTRALKIALDFAKRYGSKVTAFIVNDGSLSANEVKRKVEYEASSAGVNVDIKIVDLDRNSQSTATKIIEEAVEGNYDIIIIAARGRTVSEEIVIGSTALSIIVNVPISVLLVR
ncbi:MAG: universal stress protein [Desulfurococcales archaeon]|nr:universal stress protein [Desulfurococcales archaeon]